MNAIGGKQSMGVIGSDVTGDFPQSPIGVTAQDVVARSPVPQTNFDFNMRGGMMNTVAGGLDKMIQKQNFEKQKKLFEELLQRQRAGADEAYNEAVKTYTDEVKNWIPTPDLFYDDQTRAFMPFKYYESFATGIKEFQKFKSEDAKRQMEAQNQGFNQGAKAYELGQKDKEIAGTQDYRGQMVGIGNRNANTSEANAITNATQVSNEQENRETTANRTMMDNVRNSITKANTDLTALGGKLMDPMLTENPEQFSDYSKQKRDLQKHLDNLYNEYSTMKYGGKVTPEAVKIGTQIDDQAEGNNLGPKSIGVSYGLNDPNNKAGLIAQYAQDSGIPIDQSAIKKLVDAGYDTPQIITYLQSKSKGKR